MRIGTRSFIDAVVVIDNELIIFGWIVFPSKKNRDLANEKVPNDPRIADLIAPLIQRTRLIFDAARMVYGGFQSLIEVENNDNK